MVINGVARNTGVLLQLTTSVTQQSPTTAQKTVDKQKEVDKAILTTERALKGSKREGGS